MKIRESHARAGTSESGPTVTDPFENDAMPKKTTTKPDSQVPIVPALNRFAAALRHHARLAAFAAQQPWRPDVSIAQATASLIALSVLEQSASDALEAVHGKVLLMPYAGGGRRGIEMHVGEAHVEVTALEDVTAPDGFVCPDPDLARWLRSQANSFEREGWSDKIDQAIMSSMLDGMSERLGVAGEG